MKVLFDQTKKSEWYVSEDGKVFLVSKHNNSVYEKKPHIHKQRKYVYIRTTNKNHLLHRLIASAFIENTNNKPCINHIDGNKENNNVSNLEWVTYRENSQHAFKNGLTKKMNKNEGNIKYTNEQCKNVLQRVRDGMKYIDAGSIYNMPYSTVAHLMRGSRRKI